MSVTFIRNIRKIILPKSVSLNLMRIVFRYKSLLTHTQSISKLLNNPLHNNIKNEKYIKTYSNICIKCSKDADINYFRDLQFISDSMKCSCYFFINCLIHNKICILFTCSAMKLSVKRKTWKD